MENDPPARRKKTKSELLRLATLHEYVEAHARPNGHGWKGFVRSNLFGVLILFLLSQLTIVAGLLVANYYKTNELSEWRGKSDSMIVRMDEQGTHHSQNEGERFKEKIARLETKVEKLEDQTKHIEVMETEYRYMVKDVEGLKNGKK